MDPRFRRSLKISTLVHLVIIGSVIVASLVSEWVLRWKRKQYTVIDLTLALPEIPAEALRAVEPAPAPPREPPKDVPEEIKPKPKPQVQKSTKRVVREPPKPNTPRLSPEEIRRLLAAGARISDKATLPTNEFPEAWYYALVKQTMYEAWTQPSAAAVPVGTRATVTIRVERDGTVSRRELVRSSGYPAMDESVMNAVKSVSRLRPLPPAWSGPFKDIEITFELSGDTAVL